jgi:hypothetical protein
MVLVEIKMTISSECSEKISVLWEMAHSPDRRLVSQLSKSSITLLGVVCFQIEDVELAF